MATSNDKTTKPGAHALVFGASGVAGWAVVDQILSAYPKPGTFEKVTALVNRPLTPAEAYWPASGPGIPNLDLVSGTDLTEGSVEEFAKELVKKVDGVRGATHVYYFAYKQIDDPQEDVKVNCAMFRRVLGAANILCPNLEFVVFPSGAKAYGIHSPDRWFTAPFKESMGRLPQPAASTVHYYNFQDMLAEASKGKAWTWCDIRPDAVIGFTPNGSTFNLTSHWATYLSTYALVEGKGAQVPFPGTTAGYEALFNEVSSEMMARYSIWASLNPTDSGGEIFNVADNAQADSMRERWPALASYFELEGVGPEESEQTPLRPGDYIRKHGDVLNAHGVKAGQVFKSEFLDEYGYHFTFDRHFILEKARKAGFTEETDPKLSWYKAFDRFKAVGMIPP